MRAVRSMSKASFSAVAPTVSALGTHGESVDQIVTTDNTADRDYYRLIFGGFRKIGGKYV